MRKGSNIIWIGNLPSGLRERHILYALSIYGVVEAISFCPGNYMEGACSGCFVKFETREAANRAVMALDEKLGPKAWAQALGSELTLARRMTWNAQRRAKRLRFK